MKIKISKELLKEFKQEPALPYIISILVGVILGEILWHFFN
jgi:hypothetical protein